MFSRTGPPLLWAAAAQEQTGVLKNHRTRTPCQRSAFLGTRPNPALGRLWGENACHGLVEPALTKLRAHHTQCHSPCLLFALSCGLGEQPLLCADFAADCICDQQAPHAVGCRCIQEHVRLSHDNTHTNIPVWCCDATKGHSSTT